MKRVGIGATLPRGPRCGPLRRLPRPIATAKYAAAHKIIAAPPNERAGPHNSASPGRVSVSTQSTPIVSRKLTMTPSAIQKKAGDWPLGRSEMSCSARSHSRRLGGCTKSGGCARGTGESVLSRRAVRSGSQDAGWLRHRSIWDSLSRSSQSTLRDMVSLCRRCGLPARSTPNCRRPTSTRHDEANAPRAST